MESTRVLVVDDEPVSLALLVENLEFEGYRAEGVSSGEEAWKLLSVNPGRFDVILLDRMLPDMDGIELLRRLKAAPAFSRASVIMQTALSSDSDVVDGLRSGAYYYLTKPFTSQALFAIVEAATRDRLGFRKLEMDVQQATQAVARLDSARFSFQSLEEAWNIAILVAKATPNPERTVGGLSELMLNAVEHGNLEIMYEQKSLLLAADRWKEEIARRLILPGNRDKFATLTFERRPREFRFTIRDEGPGFVWQNYMELSPERAFHLHGRGIAMSRQVWFDQLEYKGCGNEVQASVFV